MLRPVQCLQVETAIIRVLRQHFADRENWWIRRIDANSPLCKEYKFNPESILLYYPPTISDVYELGNFFGDGVPSSSFNYALKSMAKTGVVEMFRTVAYVHVSGNIHTRKPRNSAEGVVYLSSILNCCDNDRFYPADDASPICTKKILPEASCQSKQ